MELSSDGLVVRYRCPHCGAALEWTMGGWGGWVRCPACDRPGPPPRSGPALPKPLRAAEEATGSRAALRAEHWIASGDLPDPTWPPWSRSVSAPKPGVGPNHRAARAFLGAAPALGLLLLWWGATGLAALVLLAYVWVTLKWKAPDPVGIGTRRGPGPGPGGGSGSGRPRPPGRSRG